ncbi:MAG: exopolysaccharide biosynthesis WecB/TagA/CpsF family protein [Arenicella sp.]|jgi:exopolysaccharide biosynthesis WecB/TagA/CpsF family protein
MSNTHYRISKQRQEIILAWLLIAVLSIIFIARGVLAWLFTRTILSTLPYMKNDGEIVNLYHFSGSGPFRRLARLINVINGDVQLSGASLVPFNHHDQLGAEVVQQDSVQHWPCGLYSPQMLKIQTGIAFSAEHETLNEYYANWKLTKTLSLILRSALSPKFKVSDSISLPGVFSLFGINVNNGKMADAITAAFDDIDNNVNHSIAFVNADCLNKAYTDSDYFNSLQAMERIYPDGIGVRLAARMIGLNVVENINGTDLFPQLCADAAQQGKRVFLLGGREEVAQIVADKMCDQHPGLIIAGVQHGYFNTEQESEVIERINRLEVDILCVAFGAPKQEEWIAAQRKQIIAPVIIGLGGCFDFYADRIPRAPLWLREMGLEWTYRLYQEPGRMWKRYIVGNPLFLYRMWRLGKNRLHARRVTQYQTNRLINHLEEYDLDKRNKSLFKRNLKRYLWLFTIDFSKALKRIIDITASGLGLIILSPAIVLVAILIKSESKGPVFYHQKRVGIYGREFKFWKFRSMYPDADKRQQEMMESSNEMQGRVIFKMKEDPRITKIGHWIRRFSVDELPQLWNVLIGDMSLVGPRPALPSEVTEYDLDDRDRLGIQPGITCIWQVSGRSDIPFDQQVKLDRQYISSQSIWGDILILLKTVPAVLTGKGAY